jgi:hypothetical protein
MEYFIEQARIVLPVLGVNVFRSPIASLPQPAESVATDASVASPVFELRLKKQGILATAQEWVTYEGSLTYGDWQRQGVDDALQGATV